MLLLDMEHTSYRVCCVAKIRDLRRYVTKTLVNAGEDVMNTIIGNLHAKRGSPVSCAIGLHTCLAKISLLTLRPIVPA